MGVGSLHGLMPGEATQLGISLSVSMDNVIFARAVFLSITRSQVLRFSVGSQSQEKCVNVKPAPLGAAAGGAPTRLSHAPRSVFTEQKGNREFVVASPYFWERGQYGLRDSENSTRFL